jgi:hypothetical protein
MPEGRWGLHKTHDARVQQADLARASTMYNVHSLVHIVCKDQSIQAQWMQARSMRASVDASQEHASLQRVSWLRVACCVLCLHSSVLIPSP